MVPTATAASTIDIEAFNQLVLEKRLTPWTAQGYLYAGYLGPNGHELYRTACKKRYFWSYTQVCTQDNVAGGNLVCQITPVAGSAMILHVGRYTASGNRAVQTTIENADGTTVCYLSAIGAVASATATIAPAAGSATSSSAAQEGHAKPVAYPNFLEGALTAATQTESVSIVLIAEIIGAGTRPTVSWAGSTGTPNASAAAEDTLTEVVDCR